MSEIQARFLTRRDVCKRLRISVGSSYKKLPLLEKAGFPRMDPILRRWDAVAIDRYLDARLSLVNPSPVKDYRGASRGL